MKKNKIILGIDPGSSRAGFGVIKQTGNKLEFISCGVLNVVSKTKNEKMLELEKEFSKLVKKINPDLASIEKLFFTKNMKTATEVSECRGILTLIILKHKIPLLEYGPHEVKLSVCGYGKADKKSVAKMAMKILGIEALHGPDDASDAVAIAITAAFHDKFKNIK